MSTPNAAFLAEASRLLAQSLDYETTLATVAGLALPALGAWCIVDLVEESGTLRRLAIVHPDAEQQARARRLEQGWPPERADPIGAPAVLDTGESVLIPRVDDELLRRVARDPANLALLRELEFGSLAIVALKGRGDQVMGAITFVSPAAAEPYRELDVELAEDLAARAGLAIENARLHRKTVRAKETAVILQALTGALSRSITREEVARVAVTTAAHALGASAGFVGELDAGGAALAGVQTMGHSSEFVTRWARVPLEVDVPITAAARTGEFLYFRSRADRDARFPALPGPTEFEAVAAAPFVVEDRVLGAWAVHFDHPRDFSADDRAFFTTITQACAQALDRARLFTAAERARADAEAANRAKSQFLATTSHEIRTPINAIIGYTQLLEMGLRGPLSPEQHETLERIQASAQHLLGLINEVLDLAKVEAGQMTVRVEPAEVADTVADALTLVEPQVFACRLELVNRCANAPPVHYLGDPLRVRQILSNLLANACKFTPGGGRLVISCGYAGEPSRDARLSGAGPWAYVAVEDTGIGIGADQLERVFEPFVQASQDLTRTEGGSGLGLAIARQLARMMAGDLTVESDVGSGSTFTLWLPGLRSAAAAPAAPAESGPGTLAALARVLLARRDEIMRGYGERLRLDPVIPRADGEPEMILQDHAVNFLSGVAQHFASLAESGETAASMARDTDTIQRTIAELHGAQRRRLGWGEEALRRDWQIFRDEIEAVLRAHAAGEVELASALNVVARMLERAERTSVRAWHLAGHRTL